MTRAVTLAGFAAVALVALVLEVAARRWGRGVRLGDALAQTVNTGMAVRIVALSTWLWLGWHLFVRVHWN